MSLSTLLVAVGALVALVLLVMVVLAWLSPVSLQRRVEAPFRRPDPPAKTAGEEQYYRPYWSR